MDLTLNYASGSDDVKSQNSLGQINLALGYNAKPYDLHIITDQKLTVKIGNSKGYLKDITVDVSNEDDNKKYQGLFTIPLSNPDIKNLPPDTYYLEVWVNVKDQGGNVQQLIFPSDYVLPFTISANMVNGSDEIPMVSFDSIKQDWNDFKSLVSQHEAEAERINVQNSAMAEDVSNADADCASYANDVSNVAASFSASVNTQSLQSTIDSMVKSGVARFTDAVTSSVAISLADSAKANGVWAANSVASSTASKMATYPTRADQIYFTGHTLPSAINSGISNANSYTDNKANYLQNQINKK